MTNDMVQWVKFGLTIFLLSVLGFVIGTRFHALALSCGWV